MDEKKSYQILQFAEDHDGYVSVSEAKRFGIAQTYLVLAEEEGQFEKVAKGLYVKKGYPIDHYYITHYRYPKIIFHLRSAAFLYHWIENDDQKMSVKCPRNYMTSGIEGCMCKHVNSSDYEIGIGIALTDNGQIVPVTDKERTLLDFIKRKKDYDSSFLKQIISNAMKDSLDWNLLETYAKELGQEDEAALLKILFAE